MRQLTTAHYYMVPAENRTAMQQTTFLQGPWVTGVRNFISFHGPAQVANTALYQ